MRKLFVPLLLALLVVSCSLRDRVGALVNSVAGAVGQTVAASDALRYPELARIRLPPGFRIEVYANQVPNARSMTLSPGGTLFVGTRSGGDLYALVDRDRDRDFRADSVYVLARGLNSPNGVACRDGALYVA